MRAAGGSSGGVPDETHKNFITWPEFMKALEQERTLTFELSAKEVDGSILTQKCEVDVEPVLYGLRTKHWSAPTCWPID
jgi:hypothetical protein